MPTIHITHEVEGLTEELRVKIFEMNKGFPCTDTFDGKIPTPTFVIHLALLYIMGEGETNFNTYTNDMMGTLAVKEYSEEE